MTGNPDVAYPHNGTVLAIRGVKYYTRNNMGEPRQHHARRKKPVTKGQILYDSTCAKFRESRAIDRRPTGGCQGLDAWKWEVTAVTANGHVAALKGDEDILESDSGNGCTTW